MYLTYNGILRVLFASLSDKVDNFVRWVTKTLFTAQLGTFEAKQELSSKLLGVHALTIKEVFNTSSTNVSCVYLFTIGTVKDLKGSMSIDKKYKDDMVICKYGKAPASGTSLLRMGNEVTLLEKLGWPLE